MLICLGITIAFPFFFGMTQRNFVHKVVVDFNKSILSLSMFRSNKIITASFDDIEKIYIKGYIVFKLPGRKVYCNSAADHKLIACLNKIMLVS